MYSPGSPYIVVAPVVTSWAVAGQRMVFFHVFLQARVTLEAFPIVAPRGRSVSFPTRGTMVTYVTWDVPLHGNFKLRPLGATMGNVIPTPPCWGECKPNSRRRRAQVNSTIWLRELPLFGRLMLSVTLSSFGQKPELHTWSTYLLGAGITGPKVELTGLESFLYRKIPLRG